MKWEQRTGPGLKNIYIYIFDVSYPLARRSHAQLMINDTKNDGYVSNTLTSDKSTYVNVYKSGPFCTDHALFFLQIVVQPILYSNKIEINRTQISQKRF